MSVTSQAQEIYAPPGGNINFRLIYEDFTGDYRSQRLLYPDLDSLPPPASINAEDFLFRRVGELLRDCSRPAVVLDAGPAGALTLLRIGEYFRSAVKDKSLVLAAAGLGKRIVDFVSDMEGEQRDEAQALAANSRIHEITTDFSPGSDLSVRVGGKRLDLRRQTDLIHEKLSVTAWAPASAYELGMLTSPRGIYMVRDTDTLYGQPGRRRRTPTERRRLVEMHAQLMLDADLSVVHEIEVGRRAGSTTKYRFFKGADAAPISVAD